MTRIAVKETPLEGLQLLVPQLHGDERGFFLESWNQEDFSIATGCETHFVQDNHSRSRHGVLRGLHFQIAPMAQAKLVRVVRGEIWDVVVDVRKTSATFGKWFGVTLNGDDPTMLWIPPGFAHGFLCMSEVADVLYKTSAPWSAEHERTILWDDEELNIDWPTLEANEPILSPKDLEGQPFAEWRTA